MEEAVNIIVAMKGLRFAHVNPTMHIVVHVERLRLTIVKCLANVSIGASSIPVIIFMKIIYLIIFYSLFTSN